MGITEALPGRENFNLIYESTEAGSFKKLPRVAGDHKVLVRSLAKLVVKVTLLVLYDKKVKNGRKMNRLLKHEAGKDESAKDILTP